MSPKLFLSSPPNFGVQCQTPLFEAFDMLCNAVHTKSLEFGHVCQYAAQVFRVTGADVQVRRGQNRSARTQVPIWSLLQLFCWGTFPMLEMTAFVTQLYIHIYGIDSGSCTYHLDESNLMWLMKFEILF